MTALLTIIVLVFILIGNFLNNVDILIFKILINSNISKKIKIDEKIFIFL